MNETTAPMEEIKVVFLGDDSHATAKIIERMQAIKRMPRSHCYDKTLEVDGTPVLVHFWNFCQPSVLSPAHRLFMTGRTIYVLVINCRANPITQSEKYWLNEINWFASQSTVLTVLNGEGFLHTGDFDEEALFRLCPALSRRIKLDVDQCDEEEFDTGFRQELLDMIRSSESRCASVPDGWHRVMARLREQNQPYLANWLYQSICADVGISDREEQNRVLNWLNDAGVCFVLGKAQEYVVLRSHWLVGGVRAILFDKIEGMKNGLVSREALLRPVVPNIKQRLAGRMPYNTHELAVILDALRDVGACIQADENREFIPSRAQSECCAEVELLLGTMEPLELRMDCNGSAEYLLHRLMAELRGAVNWPLCWGSGALFEHRYSGVDILIVAQENQLCFYVRCRKAGGNYEGFLGQIIQVLEAICKKQGQRLQPLTVVHRDQGTEELFSYDTLMNIKRKGVDAVYSAKQRRMIPLSDVLKLPKQMSEQRKEKLQSDVIIGCVTMQQKRERWTASERDCSKFLFEWLNQKGYPVLCQTNGGHGSGETDLLICGDDRQPWVVADILQVTEQVRLREWNDHLKRLLAQSDAIQAPLAFLISYVRCNVDDFFMLWEEYDYHMRVYDSPYARSMRNYQHLFPMREMPGYVRVAQCTYDIGGKAVSLTHFFVHLGDKTSRSQSQVYNLERELKQQKVELAHMQARLSEERQAREQATQEAVAVKARLDQLDAKAKRYIEENDALRNENSQRERDSGAYSRQLEEKIRQTEQEQARLRMELRLCQQEVDERQARVDELTARNRELEYQSQRLHRESEEIYTSAERSVSQARTHLEWAEQPMMSEMKYHVDENNALRSENQRIRAYLEELRSHEDALRQETLDQAQALERLNRELEQREEAYAAMRSAMTGLTSEKENLEQMLRQSIQDAETAREAETASNQARQEMAEESARMAELVSRLELERQAALEGERQAWEEQRDTEARVAEGNARIEQLRRELETAQAQLATVRAAQTPPVQPPEESDDGISAATEYRVIIMGDSEAGKSQILHRLKCPGRDPREFSGDVTPGIDIVSRCYTIGDRQVRVNFWDFGGQEILHSMHRMFLARNTLYVIVLNTRNDNQDEQARFWLRYVDVYAPGAPVLLVMNKIDQNENARLNMPALLREFGDRAKILEVLSISARDWPQEHFQKVFVDRLLNHIAAVLHQANTFKAHELRIRDRIRAERDTHRVIDMDDFCDICYDAGLKKTEDQKKLADRFHTTGVFVYFGTRTQMLLDPQWITDAVYRILKRRRELAANGIVDCETIEELLVRSSDKAYRRTHVRFILDIMRRFGLSFPYQEQVPGVDGSRDLEFIPMLCQREEPPEMTALINRGETIQMQIVFTYLPAGLVYQLIVDLQKELEPENVWLYGAAFRNSDGCRAVVRRERNRLFLYVQGQNRVLALKYMDNFMSRIKDQVIGEQFTTRITQVLIGYPVQGTVEFFDYDRLTLAKEKNLSYVISKARGEAVAVQDILDQTDRSAERPVQELLRLTMLGCEALQMNQTYWFHPAAEKTPKMDENARNRLLQLVLSRSFFVKDQPQGGESARGTSPGELDLLVGLDKDTPLAILEALNISGDNADSRNRWTEHLKRMMERYNKSGLRNLVLVSYLNCPESQFANVAKAYFELLEQTESEPYNGGPRACDIHTLARCPERLHVARADYAGGAGAVTVYHFLVHIPQYTGRDAEKK